MALSRKTHGVTRRPRHLESLEQQALMRRAQWTRYRDGVVRDYLYAVPNGGKRSVIEASIMKGEGVTPGVPDIECMVAVPPYTGLHIEMKRADGKLSDLTDAQKQMIARLISCGRKVIVAFGADHAWRELCDYLGIDPKSTGRMNVQ